jgi:superfamily II DNA or RNA helicase
MTSTKINLKELEELVKAGYYPKIDTPSGFKEIVETYRKNGPGYQLFFSDGSYFKCARDHKILVNNEWLEAHEIKINTPIEGRTNTKSLIFKLPVMIQDWIDFTVDADHHSYWFNDMIHHNSGKSLIIYLIQQHYYRAFQHRTLIIVPTISLVHQMAGDFIDYGCDPDLIYKILGGVDKNTTKPITVSTWQSLQKQPKEWFDQFRVVIGDEAHLFTGTAIKGIMERCTEASYRFGLTGTISNSSKTHRLVLSGLFGPIKRFVTTKNLIDAGTVAEFKIKALVLGYPQDIKDNFRKKIRSIQKEKRFHAEKEFITNNEKRNLFIRNLVWSLEGQNNLILFELVEKHGKILEPLLRKEGRNLHFIYGNTPGEERERIRHLIENDPNKNHDILASFGTMSTGTNLKRLDNLILASGSKSEIRILQSIGRTLRKGNGADKATLYDITDDLSHGSYINYTLEHFKKRIEIYSSEHFSFKIYNINLN